MKILFYNWVDYLDDENRGGGVSVYQRNVIRELGVDDSTEIFFLSAGISYDLLSNAPRWERAKHGPSENRRRRFEIVNGGTLSPSHHSFGSETQLEEPDTHEVFMDFIRRHGPFDVVHFNNLEGIPASVLKLKEEWPETRVILSLHNYYPLCPQVNLWFQERENCLDFDGGRKCETCLTFQHDKRIVRLANAVAFNLKKRGVRPGTRAFDRGFGPAMRVAARLVRILKPRGVADVMDQDKDKDKGKLLKRIEVSHRRYSRRRSSMVDLINTNCDRVLCVSARVGDVAMKFGIDPKLVQTSYIGTRHAEKFEQTQPAMSFTGSDGSLTLAYLGYMRRDKGFFFLLEALENLPPEIGDKVNVVLASRLIDQPTMDRITALSEKLNSVLFADGYNHEQLDDLLNGVTLGLVPVLWEDNLPQVAIEMHARHIPLLTSDLGGAQELGNCPDLVFKAGDKEDFATRLAAVLAGDVSLDDYWKGARAPQSMPGHIAELKEVYDAPARTIGPLPS